MPPDHLGHDVGHALGQLHAPRGDEPEGDRRVDVAARDRPDGVDEGDEHEAEGQGGGGHPGGIAQTEELETEGLSGDADGDDDEDQVPRNSAASFLGSRFMTMTSCVQARELDTGSFAAPLAQARIPAANYLLTG